MRRLRNILTSVLFVLTLLVYLLSLKSDQTISPQVPDTTSTATSSAALVPVIRDVDGDTIVVFLSGATTTVRLLGVDTPEDVDPRKPVQCFAREAAAETKHLVEGQRVRLELDPSQGEKDTYGRTLAYVYLQDGTLLDELLIQEGFGREYTYDKPYKYQSEFKNAQAEAKAARLGLWSPQTCNGSVNT